MSHEKKPHQQSSKSKSERHQRAEELGVWFATASLEETQQFANEHGDRTAQRRDQRR